MAAATRPGTYSIAFYNVENLFDTINDPGVNDEAFTPDGFFKWTPKRLKKKIERLATTIVQIGNPDNTYPPAMIGLAEVENHTVLDMLVEHPVMAPYGYGYIHFPSPDERGIDVAMLYRKSFFSIVESTNHRIDLKDDDGLPDATRDILEVGGTFNGVPLRVFVNHWPSRRSGVAESEHRRMEASRVLSTLVDARDEEYQLILGDFNDEPGSKSIQQLESHGFFNPMDTLRSFTRGSLNHQRTWYVFDQILVSHPFLSPRAKISFEKADIYDPEYLKEQKGRFKGQPFRTYGGGRYLGGYSDHFPVYVITQMPEQRQDGVK